MPSLLVRRSGLVTARYANIKRRAKETGKSFVHGDDYIVIVLMLYSCFYFRKGNFSDVQVGSNVFRRYPQSQLGVTGIACYQKIIKSDNQYGKG